MASCVLQVSDQRGLRESIAVAHTAPSERSPELVSAETSWCQRQLPCSSQLGPASLPAPTPSAYGPVGPAFHLSGLGSSARASPPTSLAISEPSPCLPSPLCHSVCIFCFSVSSVQMQAPHRDFACLLFIPHPDSAWHVAGAREILVGGI